MAKFMKLIGGKPIEMEVDVPEAIMISRGWVLKAEFPEEEPEPETEEMEDEPIEVPSIEELQKPKRGRKPKQVKQ